MREDDTEKFMNDAETRRTFNDNIIQEFRANGGRVDWSDPGGATTWPTSVSGKE